MIKLFRIIVIICLILSSDFIFSQGPYNQTIVVTKTTDPDPFITQDVVDGINTNPVDINLVTGTLQWALRKANADTGPDHIVFSSNLFIQLEFDLPIIREEIFIDGTYHSGYVEHNNMVHISGLQPNSTKLYQCFMFYLYPPSVTVGNFIIKGIYIHDFNYFAVNIYKGDYGVIEDNIINRLGQFSRGIRSYGSYYLVRNNILGKDLQQDFPPGPQRAIEFVGIHRNIFSNQIGGVNQNDGNIIKARQGISIHNASLNTVIQNNVIRRNIIEGTNTVYKGIGLDNSGLVTIPNENKPKPIINIAFTNGYIQGTAEPYDEVEIFEATHWQNATKYLTTVTADANGDWSVSGLVITTNQITATATDQLGKNSPELENTSELATKLLTMPCPIDIDFGFSGLCLGSPTDFNIITTEDLTGATITWDFDDGSPSASGVSPSHQYASAGTYTVTLDILFPNGCTFNLSHTLTIEVCCEQCIGSFAPIPGERYVLSAWVKEDTPNQVETYVGPEIELDFGFGQIAGPYTAKGNIIEGWQKIEEVFTIPNGAYKIEVFLNNTGNNDVYFDDIRISPFNSSMKSYVYDPVSLRLWAELDDRNYATFYQYDEEGKLIRIKKETARGIETIQESREGSYKKEKVFDEKLNLNDSSN